MALTQAPAELLNLDSGITISTADNLTQLTLTSTDADASPGPQLDMVRDSASPADSDVLGRIRFRGDNDAGEVTTMVYLQTYLHDASDGTEDGGLDLFARQGGTLNRRITINSSGEICFNEDSADIDFRVESNGNANMFFVDGGNNRVGIGTNSPAHFLDVQGTALMESARFSSNDGTTYWDIRRDSSSGDLVISDDGLGDVITVDQAGGNFMVGTTDTNPANDGSGTGVALGKAGWVSVARDGDHAGMFNRLTSDGTIVSFHKDGTQVGSIRSYAGARIAIGSTGAAGLLFGGSNIYPATNATVADDTYDLGSASYRFDDIYATNGTIQTSDRNEKQDIDALSDAEKRVAVAAKGLLRKFRWKSAVEEKGDDARIHFGIIAQDLQDAFTAEGLDASRYAMFCSNTWTDEETGEERTRMGVRYSELLAFIIAAI